MQFIHDLRSLAVDNWFYKGWYFGHPAFVYWLRTTCAVNFHSDKWYCVQGGGRARRGQVSGAQRVTDGKKWCEWWGTLDIVRDLSAETQFHVRNHGAGRDGNGNFI